MDVIPSWRTPHYFSRISVENEKNIPRPLFTYGLLSLELAAADLTDLPRAASRVGLEWVASLADRLYQENDQEDPARRSPLTRFIKDKVGIKKPGDVSSRLVWGERPPGVPRAVLDAFVEEDLPRVRTFLTRDVQPLVAPLQNAAKQGGRPDPAEVRTLIGDGLASALHLLTVYTPRLALSSFSAANGRTLWGLQFSDLAERIAVELFELYALQARVRRCRDCGRVFVPRKTGESACRGYIWPEGQRKAIELCTGETFAAYDARTSVGAHRRERLRLWAKRDRERKRAGGRITPRVIRAEKEYDDYMQANRRKPGPPQRPSPNADTTRDK